VDQFIPGILLWASAPVMVFKQYVNVIQLVEGSRWLVRGDREYRREMGLVKKRVE
jgi:CDP-diacylglycerol--inositol 3-phosphatidyltransferase